MKSKFNFYSPSLFSLSLVFSLSLSLAIAALLLLVGCRTTDELIPEPETKDMRFGVFVPKEDNKPINYADGFAWLMKRYDSIHKMNFTGVVNPQDKPLGRLSTKSIGETSAEPYIEFRLRSQTITEKNGDKWVVFPKVQRKQVIGLLISLLSDDETKMVYRTIDPNIELYKNNITLYQNALNKILQNSEPESKGGATKSIDAYPPIKEKLNKPVEREIEQVVIIVWGAFDPQSVWPYNPSDPLSGMPSSCFQYNDCSGGGGDSSNGTQDIEEVIIQHIDDSKLEDNKCANDVYQKLKSKDGLFKNLLDVFDGNSIVNLYFDLKSMGSKGNIAMTPLRNIATKGYVEIDLNTDVLGSSDLFIAGTFIHEMLHAKMAYDMVKMGWDGKLGDYSEINEKSLPTLLSYYKKYKYDANTSDHAFFADYYIPKVSRALAQFDGYNHSQSVYDALAWKGLEGTDVFKNRPDKIEIATEILKYFSPTPCGK